MKLLQPTSSDNKNLGIAYFGTENIWQDAHWGCGIRNSTILHYVLSGEGEDVFPELVKAVFQNREPKIKGVSYRKDSEIIRQRSVRSDM